MCFPKSLYSIEYWKYITNKYVLSTVVAILFAISWLPLGVFSLASEVLSPPDSSQSLYVTLAVCHLVAMSSALSNPIMYGWMNSNIRQELRLLMPCNCPSGVSTVIREEATTRTALHTQTHVANHRDRNESVALLVHNGDKPQEPRTSLLTEL